MIPFSPPRIDHKTIEKVTEALTSGWITTGPKTKEFENNLADFIGVKEVVCLSSATAGLQLVLHWLGIKEGDEIIIPAYTYCATANVVIHSGATPVMVDVNTSDFNINCDAVQQAITKKTKAIIAVDIGGFPVDYKQLFEIVEEIKSIFTPSSTIQKKLGRIAIISDSAHSIGASYFSKKAGALADISSFSFHAVKNLTTAEGGAVAFNLPSLFDAVTIKQQFKISSLHGQTKDALSKSKIGAWQYDVIEAGFKCNMTDLQAAIGLVELDRYEETLTKRKEIFETYTSTLKKHAWAITPIFKTENKTSSFHLYLLRIKNISEKQRNRIIELIGEKEVAVNVHYLPLPLLTFYKRKGYDIKKYPVSYDNYKSEISLPVWYDLTPENMQTVLDAVISSIEKVLND